MTDEDFLILAKNTGSTSLCKRRKIGAVLVYPFSNEISIGCNGFNNFECSECTRGIECPALHAEVQAVLSMGPFAKLATKLYVWAEVPCLNCLSYIAHQTDVGDIYCLHPSYYERFYPRVGEYQEKISMRRDYARKHGIKLHEIASLNSKFEL